MVSHVMLSDSKTTACCTSNHLKSQQVQLERISTSLSTVEQPVTPKSYKEMISCLQWLIYKRISVGTPTAEGARIEAPQAPRGRTVGCGEGVSPSPPGRGLGRGYAPSPENFSKVSSQNGEFRCNIKFSQPAFTRKLKVQQHTVLYPTIIPFTPICLTYSFWSVKPAACGF